MWELVIIPALPFLAAGSVLWSALRSNRRRLRAWQEVVTSFDLLVEEVSGPWTWRLKLKARLGPWEVRIEGDSSNGNAEVMVVVPGPPGFSGVRIRSELLKPPGAREIEVGDESFDSTFFVEGPMRLVSALLNEETRGLLIEVNAENRLEIVDGEIRTVTSDGELSSILPFFLTAGNRLAQPLLVTQCLAENALRDSKPGVRLQNLLLLARELPGDPTTAEVLRTACSDPIPEVRLRAAMALGAEGRTAPRGARRELGGRRLQREGHLASGPRAGARAHESHP